MKKTINYPICIWFSLALLTFSCKERTCYCYEVVTTQTIPPSNPEVKKVNIIPLKGRKSKIEKLCRGFSDKYSIGAETIETICELK